MKSAMLLSAILGLFAVVLSDSSRADGAGSSKDARTMCLNKVGGDPAKLQSCCDDAILVDPASKQKRLVQECVTGVTRPKSQEELTAEQRRKDDLAAERKRSADNEAHGGKVSRKASGAASPPHVDPPAAAASGTAPATPSGGATVATASPEPAATDPLAAASKAQSDCRNSKSHTAAASIASMARRFGARVPSTDCP
jgi:hypothetical protein